ncbi:MAG: LEA type 2 family protein [Bacteroidia bacterium]|nr:LEA type 2 family protein [Bacteroidia bacterium]
MVRFILFFIFTWFFLSSCRQYKEVSVSGIESFSIKKIDKKEMLTEIKVNIKNPNDFSFNIYSGKANIYLGKILLGNAKLQKKVHVPAHSSESYTLLLKTSFEKINLQDLINNFTLSDIGKLKISGHIKAGKFIVRKKIKTEYEGRPFQALDFNYTK